VIASVRAEALPMDAGGGRVWKGTAFGGARGRTDVPKSIRSVMVF
jgi:Zn-dependent alcohol dehydrogenase